MWAAVKTDRLQGILREAESRLPALRRPRGNSPSSSYDDDFIYFPPPFPREANGLIKPGASPNVPVSSALLNQCVHDLGGPGGCSRPDGSGLGSPGALGQALGALPELGAGLRAALQPAAQGRPAAGYVRARRGRHPGHHTRASGGQLGPRYGPPCLPNPAWCQPCAPQGPTPSHNDGRPVDTRAVSWYGQPSSSSTPTRSPEAAFSAGFRFAP